MNLTVLDGVKITVKPKGSYDTKGPSSDFTVKVTYLSKNTTEDTLKLVFNFDDGVQVTSVKIVNVDDAEFNYAYVNYNCPEHAERALAERQGIKIDGSNIRLNLSTKSRSASFPTPSTSQKLVQKLCHSMVSHSTTAPEAPPSPLPPPPAPKSMPMPLILSRYGRRRPDVYHYTPRDPVSPSSVVQPGKPCPLPESTSSRVKVLIYNGQLSEEDLEIMFRHFGPLKMKPNVRRGTPDYAFVDFVYQEDAQVAQSRLNGSTIKGVSVSVRSTEARGKAKAPATPSHECKQLACHPPVTTILTSKSSEYAEELTTLAKSHHVVVKLLKSSLGFSLLGSSKDIAILEEAVKPLIEEVRSVLSKKSFTLPCHYVPLFSDRERMKALLTKIENRFGVEFLVYNNDKNLEQDLSAFMETAAKQLSGKSETAAPDVSCLSMYLSSSILPLPDEQVWLWEDKDGEYTPYDCNLCIKLNQQFKDAPKGSVVHTITTKHGATDYTIDFSAMTQTNISTGKTRRIQHKTGVLVWLYADDHGKMLPYSSQDSDQIEAMKNTGSSSVLSINRRRYSFDFTRMKQINVDTKHERSIQRSIMKTTDYKTAEHQLSLVVHGLPENLEPVITLLKSELKETVVKKVNTLPQEVDENFLEEFLGIIHRYFVSAEIQNNSLHVCGIQGYVEKVMLIVKEELLAFHEKRLLSQKVASMMASPQTAGQVPDHWEPQTEKVALKPVKENSQEFTEISNQVHKTLPQAQIEKIERIQNKWQWEKYSFSKQRMFEKNSGEVNEKELFHGMKGTPPEKIYKSEQGFDFRFASSGMWGTGTYFAVNASYSDSYAYRSSCSYVASKQMILAKVLTGETYNCAPDGSLKKPPVKTQHASLKSTIAFRWSDLRKGILIRSLKTDTFEDELYDSVSGHTNGSDIFVIYDHEKAYPAYLITYR